MASCYGNSEASAIPSAKETLEKCPYLPIERSLPFKDGQIEISLTIFSDPTDFEQGFELMNEVIIEGKSWPFSNIFQSMESYRAYFHSHSAFVVKFKDQIKYGRDVLGCFYIKPNFPGRCSHVCNGGFITNKRYRGLGVGAFMGENFKLLAKDLGYRASLFNLVFANNIPSVNLWRKLGFTELAKIPKVAVLVGEDELVDAYQFYCDFYAG